MSKLSHYAFITAVAIFLLGCVTERKILIPVEKVIPTPDQQKDMTTIVPTVPRILTLPKLLEHTKQPTQPTTTSHIFYYDWDGAMQPLVGQMLQVSGVNAGSILLVANVNNCTNGSLNPSEATMALRNVLNSSDNNSKFILVSPQRLAIAKQQLRLSVQDSLGSRNKAMGLARNVGAQYVLYTNITGNINMPTLQIQLMLVPTGEILWSGQGKIQQK